MDLSQDSQSLTPGQRPREESNAVQELSRAATGPEPKLQILSQGAWQNGEEDLIYVSLLLVDLSGKLIPDSFKDMEDVWQTVENAYLARSTKKEYAAVEFLFNKENSEVLLEQDIFLQARRQPKKRKSPKQEEQRPSRYQEGASSMQTAKAEAQQGVSSFL